ncbi:MAG: transposase family protein [Actinobacteria bacterium]|nr:transposase family protein [Actinomycetota bacterium]
MDGICGKRIKASLPEIIPVLEKHNEIKLDRKVKKKLLNISAATIDRILVPEKKKLEFKVRSGTRPGTLLKHQIPIRTFAQWDENRPGFVEIDLVSHEGGNPGGDYAQSLNLTDVFSGWTETAAVKNKAQIWVFEALEKMKEELPFQMLGIDSDNGSEFINSHLFRWCVKEKITFTRSRPYRKNDNCYVEQKNWTVVRRNVGYRRYDTEEEVATLNKLYGYLGLYTNFFLPNMKLVEKTRIGSKVKKKYDDPKTPHQRLLISSYISKEKKIKLKKQYETLNPVQLKRTISILQDKLLKVNKMKKELKEKELIKTSAFKYISNESTNTHLEYIFK